MGGSSALTEAMEQASSAQGALPIQGSVQSLLEQEAALANAKQSKIGALLEERVALAKSTEERLVEIAAELKSLGWHRSKVAKTLTVTATNSTHGTAQAGAKLG